MGVKLRLGRSIWLPLATGLAFSLSAVTVLADPHTVRVEPAPQPRSGEAGPQQQAENPVKEDSPSLLRQYMWEGSFDKAGDATRAAEVELKKGLKVECAAAEKAGISAAQKAAEQARCDQLQQEIAGYGDDAEGIRKTQRIFSDVSKVSDVAAVGAIGAAAYAQFGKRNPTQADTLRSAANIQEAAGYAAYATGATDFTLGAYAYVAQKQKLEGMQETLKGKAPAAVVSKISAAAEQTKQAAYNHMIAGVAKAGVGYASMYMAKRNRKQAESLSTLDEYNDVMIPANNTAPAASGISNLAGGAPISYTNNRPTFSLADGTTTTAGSSTTASGTAPVFSGGGSLMPGSSDLRMPASSGSGGGLGGGGLGGGGALSAAGGGGGSSAPASEEKAEEEAAAEGAAKPGKDGYEISGYGGGGSRWGGGGKSSSGADDVPNIGSLLNAALGGGPGGGGGPTAATGINPNQVYRDAMTEEEGAQSAEAGVSSGSRSLFEVVRTKYTKMVRGGRVTGPGAVEVRN